MKMREKSKTDFNYINIQLLKVIDSLSANRDGLLKLKPGTTRAYLMNELGVWYGITLLIYFKEAIFGTTKEINLYDEKIKVKNTDEF